MSRFFGYICRYTDLPALLPKRVFHKKLLFMLDVRNVTKTS